MLNISANIRDDILSWFSMIKILSLFDNLLAWQFSPWLEKQFPLRRPCSKLYAVVQYSKFSNLLSSRFEFLWFTGKSDGPIKASITSLCTDFKYDLQFLFIETTLYPFLLICMRTIFSRRILNGFPSDVYVLLGRLLTLPILDTSYKPSNSGIGFHISIFNIYNKEAEDAICFN